MTILDFSPNDERMEREPQAVLLRRRHVLEWLGINARLFRQLRENDVLRPVYVGGKRPFYLKAEVRKILERASDGRERTDKEN